MHMATRPISHFLDRSIRPLFDHYVRRTTIVDGTDLLDKLQLYERQSYLKSTTLFITFDITNLYTMLPQEDSLKILDEFLREHQCHKIDGIDIDTIIQLARIVLEENVFVYDKKFYRQIQGGAMGSPFTLTLANIFMWKWEKQTILSRLSSQELYGRFVSFFFFHFKNILLKFIFFFKYRYIDDVFFTCNESENKIIEWLDSVNKFHPNIKLTYQIGKSLPFLDLFIINENGILKTSVYHKPTHEPTYLSYLSDHPRHVFPNIIYGALRRAIRYSSTFKAFENERRNIRLNLLCNGYVYYSILFNIYISISI